jgi:hypothetical protein
MKCCWAANQFARCFACEGNTRKRAGSIVVSYTGMTSRKDYGENRGESTECRNGKRYVHASAPLDGFVWYKGSGLTHGIHSNDETVCNLTRHRKANRLQDGIDRYLPISGHGFHQIVCRAKAIAAWRTASFLRPRRCATFRIFEDYGVDTTRRKPFEANWPAVSSSGRVSGGIVARCLNRHLWNQHAVNRTSLGDLHQSVKLILG